MEGERNGQIAVITGAARGFGKAFGAALAQLGATVALVDIDGPAVEKAAAEIPRAIPFKGDVTDEERMGAITRDVARAHGGIDILINNAGLHSAAYNQPVEALGLAKVRRLFDVNVMGTVACTLAAAPYMAGRPGPSIVNIASSAAYMPGAYGASKAAVIGMTLTFAKELASGGIRVNAIAPGLILTDTIRAELAPEKVAWVKAAQFLTSAEGAEQDIVEAMLYLTSSRARFVSGETIRVTGGFCAGA